MRVFVLLFNVGTDNEGLHTLQIGDRNLVLMFEEEDDATRYALLLEAQDFIAPSVEEIEQEEMEAFCAEANYECILVSQGFQPQTQSDRLLIAPPDKNLEVTDWTVDSKPEPVENDEPTMSEKELEQMRRRLEGLL